MIKAYKKDQGRLARMAAFWSMAFLVLFGSMFVYDTLYTLVEALRAPIGGLVIPVVAIDFNGAFAISASLCIGGLLLLYSWHQTEKVGDLLIETEAELYKVTWPTFQEVVNSSLVVIVCVLILMGFLAAADWVLARVFSRIVLG